ncbi:MAG TPA: CcmD family protein [Thermoanaerobaculia bacterium]|nr:CcmD family protein [Thermoanaerobaculia bacterium]
MAEGALWWVVAVNLVIWTGLFLAVWRIDRKLRDLEKDR